MTTLALAHKDASMRQQQFAHLRVMPCAHGYITLRGWLA